MFWMCNKNIVALTCLCVDREPQWSSYLETLRCVSNCLLLGKLCYRWRVRIVLEGHAKVPRAAIIRSIFESSIHIATTNDYLAQRDHETAAPIFDLLGIESGVVLMETPPQKKKATYRKQVVYGAGHTFGFDYLRDQLTLRKKEKMTLGRQIIEILDDINVVEDLFQHERCTVLVDEADSVLIDESTTIVTIVIDLTCFFSVEKENSRTTFGQFQCRWLEQF